MDDKERRSEGLAADYENKNAILRETISRSISWKTTVMKVFKIPFLRFAIFEISNFANLDFCVLHRSAHPSLGPPRAQSRCRDPEDSA
jgi:hypothetical protein